MLDNIYASAHYTHMENTTAATKGTEMTNKEAQDTIRQMLADWNKTTDAQRAEALRIAAAKAAAS